MGENETIFVHLNYIRNDIAKLHEGLSELKRELQRENHDQWEKIEEVQEKVNKQSGVTFIFATIIAGVTTALVNLGFRK